MNRHSHNFTATAKPWDCASGVSDCETCGGSGQVDKMPPHRVYRDPPGYWDAPCPDCEEQGVICCPVCGFDEVVKGYDCAVCALVHDLSPANMRRINPADLADAFAQAFNAALNAQVTP